MIALIFYQTRLVVNRVLPPPIWKYAILRMPFFFIEDLPLKKLFLLSPPRHPEDSQCAKSPKVNSQALGNVLLRT